MAARFLILGSGASVIDGPTGKSSVSPIATQTLIFRWASFFCIVVIGNRSFPFFWTFCGLLVRIDHLPCGNKVSMWYQFHSKISVIYYLITVGRRCSFFRFSYFRFLLKFSLALPGMAVRFHQYNNFSFALKSFSLSLTSLTTLDLSWIFLFRLSRHIVVSVLVPYHRFGFRCVSSFQLWSHIFVSTLVARYLQLVSDRFLSSIRHQSFIPSIRLWSFPIDNSTSDV